MSIEDKYAQLEHREHIYKLPDTYIGSIEPTTQDFFVLNAEQTEMERRTLHIVPGFLKIVDEILVNAIDHRQRDLSVRNIRVTIERGRASITVFNDGNGIDVCIHPKTQLYVPEMLFAHLLTSSNYREDERRTTGGKNGYGATLVSIFSTQFQIETVDATRQLKYTQQFTDNNQVIHPPKIVKCTTKPYTKVVFHPDYDKFQLSDGITEDLYAALIRRVYDITAVTPNDVSVYLNGTKLKIKSMDKYMELFAPDRRVFYWEQSRWKVGLVLSPDREFAQISFVNGIGTTKGGRHVDYILHQVLDRLKNLLARMPRTKQKVFKPSQIKDNLWLFVDCIIENPSFTSQTKEELTTKVAQFGSSIMLDESEMEKFVKSVSKSGDSFIERMVETLHLDASRSLKKTDGVKRSVLRGIPKLEDALLAGTKHSLSCTLILTEGDSAKASILSGLSVMGTKFRDTFGVFPLRGKFLNVRDVGLDKVSANEEVKHLKSILGLQQGKEYTPENVKELRYGSILLATDQDRDAAHIRGLLLNFFHFYWPSLLRIEGFMQCLITPIVKGLWRDQAVSFYTLKDYEQFRRAHVHEKWNFKYYKGLGTSTSAEFKEYFKHLHELTRAYTFDTDEPLVMAFTKSQAAQRKEWLRVYDPESTLEYHGGKRILLSEFVHKDLKHFSNYDNIRSIPNVIDGLKPSQRKVLYGLFKKGKGEIKVAQLASFVSEQTHYHHGEVSLEQTIVGLAQDFVGKNNVPLLEAKGQFGTRLQGGADHAQSRYIYTEVKPYTPFMFMDADQSLLTHLEEESKIIEPKQYYPIVPFVLLAGAVGIGTGYSTYIPTFHPREIIHALLARNQGDPNAFVRTWTPWFKGFTGRVELCGSDRFTTTGVYQFHAPSGPLLITELPIGTWTQPYKEFLETLMTQGHITQYIDKSTDEKVAFEITWSGKEDEIVTLFKLQTKMSLANMYLYTPDCALRRFSSITEILDLFYLCRLDMYRRRKEAQVRQLKEQLTRVREQIRFIEWVMVHSSLIFQKSKSSIVSTLTEVGFRDLETLLAMPIYWWTYEKVEELRRTDAQWVQQLDRVQNMTPESAWNADLRKLQAVLQE